MMNLLCYGTEKKTLHLPAIGVGTQSKIKWYWVYYICIMCLFECYVKHFTYILSFWRSTYFVPSKEPRVIIYKKKSRLNKMFGFYSLVRLILSVPMYRFCFLEIKIGLTIYKKTNEKWMAIRKVLLWTRYPYLPYIRQCSATKLYVTVLPNRKCTPPDL